MARVTETLDTIGQLRVRRTPVPDSHVPSVRITISEQTPGRGLSTHASYRLSADEVRGLYEVLGEVLHPKTTDK